MSSQDAVGYIEANVGADLTPSGDAVGYIEANVGLDFSAVTETVTPATIYQNVGVPLADHLGPSGYIDIGAITDPAFVRVRTHGKVVFPGPVTPVPDPGLIEFAAQSTTTSYEPPSGLSDAIDAPSVDVLFRHSIVMRFYSGRISQYATLSTPVHHESSYGLIWTTPARAARRFQAAVDASGTARSFLDSGKTGRLVAHTLVLKPLENLRAWVAPDGASPGEEPQEVYWDAETAYSAGSLVERDGQFWRSPGGTEAGQEPGVSGDWELVEAWDPAFSYSAGDAVVHNGELWVSEGFSGAGQEPGVGGSWSMVSSPWEPLTGSTWSPEVTYPAGSVVEYEGDLYIAPDGAAAGETPDTSESWELLDSWDEETTYQPGDIVVWDPDLEPDPADDVLPPPTRPGGDTGSGGEGGGGGVIEEDRGQVGRPPGGDMAQIFMRGVTRISNLLWVVDANNSIIMIINDETGGFGDVFYLNGLTDWGAWRLKDIAYDGTHLWVVRQSDNTVLKIHPSNGLVGQFALPPDTLPTAIASPHTGYAVQSQGAAFPLSSGTLNVDREEPKITWY